METIIQAPAVFEVSELPHAGVSESAKETVDIIEIEAPPQYDEGLIANGNDESAAVVEISEPLPICKREKFKKNSLRWRSLVRNSMAEATKTELLRIALVSAMLNLKLFAALCFTSCLETESDTAADAGE
jgi:hypothetical protein